MVEIRAVQPDDVIDLVVNMRQADLEELAALKVRDFVGAVAHSIEHSAFCYTATSDGKVAAIFGVVPAAGMIDPWGVPWMLGTDLVRKHQRVLMRESRPYIQRMLRAYPHLFNYVHAENHAAKRWLKSVGFSLQPAEPHGPLGAPFHRFDMRA